MKHLIFRRVQYSERYIYTTFLPILQVFFGLFQKDFGFLWLQDRFYRAENGIFVKNENGFR